MTVGDWGLVLAMLAGWACRETVFVWWQRLKRRRNR